jgi:hypothetical protein
MIIDEMPLPEVTHAIAGVVKDISDGAMVGIDAAFVDDHARRACVFAGKKRRPMCGADRRNGNAVGKRHALASQLI